MLNKDHVYVSEAVCLGAYVISHGTQSNILIASALGTFIGCQVPDIDAQHSKISHWTRPLSNCIAHFGHRGVTHSLFGLLAWYALITFVLRGAKLDFMYHLFGAAWPVFLNWLFIGYALHLAEDWFSWSGVIWLFPIKQFEHYRRWYPPMKDKKGNYYSLKYCRRHEPPVYVRTRLTKWFRYHSTDRGKKGRYERRIRGIAYTCIVLEIILMIVKK